MHVWTDVKVYDLHVEGRKVFGEASSEKRRKIKDEIGIELHNGLVWLSRKGSRTQNPKIAYTRAVVTGVRARASAGV